MSHTRRIPNGHISIELLKEFAVIAISTVIVSKVIDVLDDGNLLNNIHATSGWIKGHMLWAKAIASAPVVLVIDFIRYIPKMYRVIQKAKMSDNVGLFFYSPNGNTRAVRKSQSLMMTESLKSSKVYIRCATGWLTFAKDTAPLHEAIKTKARDIKIVLAHPESEKVMERADSLKVHRDEYKREIYKSVTFLLELKKHRGKKVQIELKFYEKTPCWKDIIIDKFAWMYHYDEGVHVDKTPCYGFSSTKNQKSAESDMYESLCDEFLTEWENPNLKKIPLSELEKLANQWKDR